jgi:geranylgeranyl pyrophosphate synthase
MPQQTDRLVALIEGYLAELALTPELGSLEAPMRHALGGKRVRPLLLSLYTHLTLPTKLEV